MHEKSALCLFFFLLACGSDEPSPEAPPSPREAESDGASESAPDAPPHEEPRDEPSASDAGASEPRSDRDAGDAGSQRDAGPPAKSADTRDPASRGSAPRFDADPDSPDSRQAFELCEAYALCLRPKDAGRVPPNDSFVQGMVSICQSEYTGCIETCLLLPSARVCSYASPLLTNIQDCLSYCES